MVLRHLFFTLTVAVVANCISLSLIPKSWNNMDILEIQNFKNGFFESHFRVKRVNRTTFGIDGPFTLTDNIYNFDVDMKFYYSALGNNQYVLMPFRYERKSVCFHMDSYFREHVYPNLLNFSDMPKAVEGQPLCSLFMKKTYTIRGFYVPEDLMPRFFNPGLYKCEFRIYKVNVTEIQQTAVVVIKLY